MDLTSDSSGDCSASMSSAQPTGESLATQANVVAAVGAVNLFGSPPPPILARLVSDVAVPALTFAVKAKLLMPPSPAMEVRLEQVSTLLAATQFQKVLCAPLSGTLPLGTVSPVGRTSTTVTNPVLPREPLLVAVNV